MNEKLTIHHPTHHPSIKFIDLCILLGCDYCDSIKGIGPKRAVELISEHKNIETIIKKLDPKKYPVPEDWPYKEARELFRNPDVLSGDKVDLKWTDPDEEGIVEFLVKDKGFKWVSSMGEGGR